MCTVIEGLVPPLIGCVIVVLESLGVRVCLDLLFKRSVERILKAMQCGIGRPVVYR